MVLYSGYSTILKADLFSNVAIRIPANLAEFIKDDSMAEYYATVEWLRHGADFLDRKYSRGHEWLFDGGVVVPASSSPHIVPVPMSVAANVDPEEAFVASLSSCHMLFFLDFASRAGLIVERYTDPAVGIMAKDDNGRLAMTRVVLRPRVVFVCAEDSADAAVTHEQLAKLHHQAHEACFIANSVRSEVVLEPDLADTE